MGAMSEGGLRRDTVGRVKLYALCCCINSVSLGFVLGTMAVVVPLVKMSLGLRKWELELWEATTAGGAALGAMLTSTIADWGGRRLTFGTAAGLFIVGSLVTAVAMGFPSLMLGIVLCSLGVGIGFAVDPVYLGEISPPEIRGFFVTWSEIAITAGQLVGVSAGLLFALCTGEDEAVWRLTALTGVVAPACLLYAVIFVLPESPRWLLTRGRRAEARRVFTESILLSEVEADALIAEIEQDAQNKPEDDDRSMVKLLTAPKSPAVRYMLLVGIGLAMVQPLTGIDAIFYNMTTTFDYLGIRHLDMQLLLLVVIFLVKLGTAFFAATLLDSVGRRPLILLSLSGAVASLGALSVLTAFPNGTSNGFILGPIALISFAFFFELGCGPVCWLVPTEVFHNSIRTRAVALAVIAGRLVDTVVIGTGPSIQMAWSWSGFFGWWTAVNVCSLAFAYRWMPETANKSLEQMHAHFESLAEKHDASSEREPLIAQRE